MKKISIFCNTCSLLFILSGFGFFEAALRFLMIGELPFTRQIVSPDGMLIGLSLAFLLVLFFIAPRQLNDGASFDPEDANQQVPRLPKRRYTRV